MTQIPKLERLLNLLAALLDTSRPLSADEIRQRVPGYPEAGPSFHRAFERDKEDLREMGVPITLQAIPGSDPPIEGYRVRKEQYYLQEPGLEPDELAALHLAASAVRLEGLGGPEALWKLGGAPAGPAGEALSALPGDPSLGPLFGALIERAPASFRYHGAERTVEPHRLDFQRGHWYLSAHDRLRGEARSFRVDRIEGEVVVGEPGGFTPPDDTEVGRRLQPWELGEGEAVTARLLVDADQAAWAVQHVGPDAVEERADDGSVVLHVPVTNRDAFRSFVLTFLEHAEILEPAELREDLLTWLERVA